MGKVGCDIWEKWVGGRKTKTLKRKFINIGAGKTHAVETFEKRRTRRRKRRQMNGCISRVSSIKVSELVLKWGAGIHLLAVQWTPRLRVTSTLTVCGMAMLKNELDSEIWGQGVCDIWEKWVV